MGSARCRLGACSRFVPLFTNFQAWKYPEWGERKAKRGYTHKKKLQSGSFPHLGCGDVKKMRRGTP